MLQDDKKYRLPSEREDNEHRLKQRQKQIDFGKNTSGYDNYLAKVPRHLRKCTQPKTPDKYKKMSKKAWNGYVSVWRKALHQYDDVRKRGIQEVTNVSPPVRVFKSRLEANAPIEEEPRVNDFIFNNFIEDEDDLL